MLICEYAIFGSYPDIYSKLTDNNAVVIVFLIFKIIVVVVALNIIFNWIHYLTYYSVAVFVGLLILLSLPIIIYGKLIVFVFMMSIAGINSLLFSKEEVSDKLNFEGIK